MGGRPVAPLPVDGQNTVQEDFDALRLHERDGREAAVAERADERGDIYIKSERVVERFERIRAVEHRLEHALGHGVAQVGGEPRAISSGQGVSF